MSPAFDKVCRLLKQLPGLGPRSAERMAMHLLVERPEKLEPLVEALGAAADRLQRCPVTGNLTETGRCPIFEDTSRRRDRVCVVENVPDLWALERSGSFAGVYHVLHGKLSPLRGVGPEQLFLDPLRERAAAGDIAELIFALSNDIEGETTCHYIQDTLLKGQNQIKVTRIGFGLPSGGGLTLADAETLRSALDGRRDFH